MRPAGDFSPAGLKKEKVMSEKKLKAAVVLELILRESETEEEANNRLYDLLYKGLCQQADHQCEFWIESAEVTV